MFKNLLTSSTLLAALALLSCAPEEPLSCPTEKLKFTKLTGCQNDGSVEFCIPSGDMALLASIQKIAPSTSCAPGGGRARCDSTKELLCFFPTGPDSCIARHGELKEAAWRQLCQIAALPQVREIVATWFE